VTVLYLLAPAVIAAAVLFAVLYTLCIYVRAAVVVVLMGWEWIRDKARRRR